MAQITDLHWAGLKSELKVLWQSSRLCSSLSPTFLPEKLFCSLTLIRMIREFQLHCDNNDHKTAKGFYHLVGPLFRTFVGV